MVFPPDYAERVYAGITGKIIGVYLGRPVEGWDAAAITSRYTSVSGYLAQPVVVTDDDISGMLTFLRALPDNNYPDTLDARQVGETWLDYILENRSTLWWGGIGVSTEHTAYQRLRDGITAPTSGSAATNGPIIAEQIGGQIFVDGWGMIAPGDPERAADFAEQASRVSHDGAAIHAARIVAAMESAAFLEEDIDRIIDIALELIPRDSLIAELVSSVRSWCTEFGFETALTRIREQYNPNIYPGVAHVVPNHAIVIYALIASRGDFGRGIVAATEAGWDTDCNAGTVGCILAIRRGIAAIEPNWRDPVADRILVSSADGGRAISDSVIETRRIVAAAEHLSPVSNGGDDDRAGAPPDRRYPTPEISTTPRFTFEFTGSVQGFRAENARVTNVATQSGRALLITVEGDGSAATPTFIQADEGTMAVYELLASPTLEPGQILTAVVSAETEATIAPIIRHYDFVSNRDGSGEEATLAEQRGPNHGVTAGQTATITWQIPETGGCPIAQVGLAVAGPAHTRTNVLLHSLDWTGAPTLSLGPPQSAGPGTPFHWRRSWVDLVDTWNVDSARAFSLAHGRGRGLLVRGTEDWDNYEISATLWSPLSRAFGVAARVCGRRRFYALLLTDEGRLQIVRSDRTEVVLADVAYPRQIEKEYNLALRVENQNLSGAINGHVVVRARDDRPLAGGGAALVVEEGSIESDRVEIRGLSGPHR